MKKRFSLFDMAIVGFPTLCLVFLAWLVFPVEKIAHPHYDKISILALRTPPAFVPPHAHPPGEYIYGDSQLTTEYITIPENSWYVGASFGTFRNAPLEIFHHATVYIIPGPGKKILLTPKGRQSIIMEATETYPPGHGYYLPKGTKLELEARFHNLTDKTYRDVFYELLLYVVPAKDAPKNMKHMVLYDLGLDKPGEEVFTVPAETDSFILSSGEKISSKSYLVFPENGKIIRLGAHFHAQNGGKWLTAFLNEKRLYTFLAAPAKEVNSVATNSDHPIIPLLTGHPFLRTVKKGDRITFSVEYVNPTPYPVTDAMGKLRVYFVPEKNPALGR